MSKNRHAIENFTSIKAASRKSTIIEPPRGKTINVVSEQV